MKRTVVVLCWACATILACGGGSSNSASGSSGGGAGGGGGGGADGGGADGGSNPSTSKPGYVDRLEIVSTTDAYGGASFGSAGPYEVVSGIVHGKLDPKNAANSGIVDLNLAPVGSDGLVAYTTDVVILRPKNAASAKRIVFYDVVNRGNKIALSFFDGAGATFAAGQQGNGLLLNQGYTIVWSGWQGDVAQSGNGGTIGTSFPVAKNADGSAVTGTSREEFVFDNTTNPETLNLTYPASTQDKSKVTFNWRETWVTSAGETWNAPSTPIDASSWQFVSNKQVQLNRPSGADNGAIYEFIYPAQDPIVMGIGFAAVRDLMSFLRNDDKDAQGNANPLADLKQAPCAFKNGSSQCSANPTTNFDVAMMEGISQSGRFTRDFLWRGFNDDARGHKVFDAMYPIIAGSRKTYTNFRFAQPGRWSKQHEDHFQPGDQFPFAYNVITDPVSGKTDGIFNKCQQSNTCPQALIHADGGYEFWGARASLVSTDGAGKDLTIPDNVRLYLVAGTNHGGGNGVGTQTTSAACSLPTSAVNETTTLRALVPALEAWVTQGKAPPQSQWPSIASGTLVPPTDQAQVHFPDLSRIGVSYPGKYNQLFVTDYSNAIPSVDLSKKYDVRVPTEDADGNPNVGVRVPDVSVPLATYTGWNPRNQGYAPGDLCPASGSTILFSATPRQGDPRKSLAERYPGGKAEYVGKVTGAAHALAGQGLLLDDDVAFYVNAAQKQTILQ
jgi:Alpha/beta hydrolase domain